VGCSAAVVGAIIDATIARHRFFRGSSGFPPRWRRRGTTRGSQGRWAGSKGDRLRCATRCTGTSWPRCC
jgi:hypothetical protein